MYKFYFFNIYTLENKKKSNIKEDREFSSKPDEDLVTVVSDDETNPIEIIKPDKSTQNIADIMETPNVSTWNKKIKDNKESSFRDRDGNIVKETIKEKTSPLLTMGLNIDNNENKDKNEIFIDAANEEEVEKINSSGKTMTDKIYPFPKPKPISKDTETNNSR